MTRHIYASQRNQRKHDAQLNTRGKRCSIFTEMADGATPSARAATRESGFGVRVINASGSVETRIFSILAVLVAIGARPAFPAIDAATHKVGHQIDAGAIMATWIDCAIVHV